MDQFNGGGSSGVAIAGKPERPEILIERDGSGLAVRGPDGRLAIAGNPLLAQAVASPMTRRSASELNCEGKMFWDQVHPTTAVHAALSERAATFIEREYEFIPQ